jgi:hypothetical protein
MQRARSESRTAWLISGIVIGLAVALYWPHEPALAQVIDRADKFAMITVPTQPGEGEAVFLLDFITGRLVGADFNAQAAQFTQKYLRNIAADFNVAADSEAQYAIVSGFIDLRGGAARAGGGTPALGGIYIAEMNSGQVILYGFAYTSAARNMPVQEIVPIARFPFREAT